MEIITGSGNDIVTHTGIVNGAVLRTNDLISAFSAPLRFVLLTLKINAIDH
ncbi:MAG: hypothetical protein RMY29_021110 [Nostoc sp. CreGUA01]|nr:hypothetical protein [Nostoc sp. CreGUA01]